MRLDESVPLVMLQFSFSNINVVPKWVRQEKPEDAQKHQERIARKSSATGVTVIEPAENCSANGFLDELKSAGYELVDALYQTRMNKPGTYNKVYHMVRYTFGRTRDDAVVPDEFQNALIKARDELGTLIDTAMWRVRVFSNPFYKKGEEMPDQRVASVNFEARKPLIQSDGQPVLVWQKDDAGNKIGDAPLPLQSSFMLQIVDGRIQITSAVDELTHTNLDALLAQLLG